MSVNEVYFRDMTPSKKVFFLKKNLLTTVEQCQNQKQKKNE